MTNSGGKICVNPFSTTFGLLTFPEIFRNLTFASWALLTWAKCSSQMMENPAFFPVNTGQDLVEWFSVRTVRIRLSLLYVSHNKNVSKAGKVLVSCGLQWVSCWPLQTRSIQAMLARYVVQIVLTCLH